MSFLFKVIFSSLIIAAVSELAKKSTLLAAVLVSLPLTSILALFWLYHDTHDTQKVIDLSFGIFGAVLPSLIFFLILPLALKSGLRFGWAMVISSAVMVLSYTFYTALLSKFGIKI